MPYRVAYHLYTGGRDLYALPFWQSALDGFAVALPVGLDEVEEVGAGVFGRDAFPLYPVKILPGEVGNIPFPS